MLQQEVVNAAQQSTNHAYKTYLSKHPDNEIFLKDVVEKDNILHQMLLYAYSPTGDIELRRNLEKDFPGGLNRKYIQQLLVREGPEWVFYEPLQKLSMDFHLARYADTWKNRAGEELKGRGIETIEQIRAYLNDHIGKIEEREYISDVGRVEETILYEWFPFFLFISREIFDKQTWKTKKVDSELVFSDWNIPQFEQLKYFWEKYSVIEILQAFRDRSEIMGIVWNIKPDIEYSVILSHKGDKIEFPLNLLHRERYYNLVARQLWHTGWNILNTRPLKWKKIWDLEYVRIYGRN